MANRTKFAPYTTRQESRVPRFTRSKLVRPSHAHSTMNCASSRQLLLLRARCLDLYFACVRVSVRACLCEQHNCYLYKRVESGPSWLCIGHTGRATVMIAGRGAASMYRSWRRARFASRWATRDVSRMANECNSIVCKHNLNKSIGLIINSIICAHWMYEIIGRRARAFVFYCAHRVICIYGW